MDTETRRFRVLVAEDDPVSRSFLLEAVRACGVFVDACMDGGTTLARARAEPWELLLLDHHLPDLPGDAVLRALRNDEAAASRSTPAVATSAAGGREAATLLAAGFAEVLAKPTTMDAVRHVVRRNGGPAATSVLDDVGALDACGSIAAMKRLRRLLLEQDLPALDAGLARSDPDFGTLRLALHRLHAACGFCGAHALADAGAALDRALASGARGEYLDAPLAAFRRAIQETRVVLAMELDTPDPTSS